MSVQTAVPTRLQRWQSYEKLAEDQLDWLGTLDWLAPQLAQLEALSSWAIASAMWCHREDLEALPLVPVIPMPGMNQEQVSEYMNLIPVPVQDLEVTGNLASFSAPGSREPATPYYLFGVGVQSVSFRRARPPGSGELGPGRRCLSGSEIMALAINSVPEVMESVGLWAGAIAFEAVDQDDRPIGFAHPFVLFERGMRTVLRCGHGVPEKEDRLVWPTCEVRPVRVVGEVVGAPPF